MTETILGIEFPVKSDGIIPMDNPLLIKRAPLPCDFEFQLGRNKFTFRKDTNAYANSMVPLGGQLAGKHEIHIGSQKYTFDDGTEVCINSAHEVFRANPPNDYLTLVGKREYTFKANDFIEFYSNGVVKQGKLDNGKDIWFNRDGSVEHENQ